MEAVALAGSMDGGEVEGVKVLKAETAWAELADGLERNLGWMTAIKDEVLILLLCPRE